MTTYIGVPRSGGSIGGSRQVSVWYPLGPGVVISAAVIPDSIWRGRQALGNPGMGAAQIGMSASLLWAGSPYFTRYINIPAGAAGTLYAITSHPVADTPRVSPTACAESPDFGVYIWRGVWRWSNATPYG